MRVQWPRATFAYLVRYRWPLLVAIALISAIVPQASSVPTDIDNYFLEPAVRLVGHGDLNVFAPDIQVGPLSLVLLGIGAVLGRALGLSLAGSAAALMGLIALCITAAAVRAVLPERVSRGRRSAYELYLGVGLMGGCGPLAAGYGQVQEMFLSLMLVVAASALRQGRGRRAGLWLGCALAFKLWAILGIALLVLSPRRRDAVIAAIVALLVGGLSYLPFVLAGNFRMFEYVWTVHSYVPMSYVLGTESVFGFRARLLQVAVSLGVGVVVAVRLRRDPVAVWVVPATLVSVRLLHDPRILPYYWTGLAACFVIGAGTATRWPPLKRAVVAVATMVIVLAPGAIWRDEVNRLAVLILSAGCVLWCLGRAWHTRSPDMEAGPSSRRRTGVDCGRPAYLALCRLELSRPARRRRRPPPASAAERCAFRTGASAACPGCSHCLPGSCGSGGRFLRFWRSCAPSSRRSTRCPPTLTSSSATPPTVSCATAT